MTLREQAKAVTGGVLAGLGALLTAVVDSSVSLPEWVTVAIATVGAYGAVWGIRQPVSLASLPALSSGELLELARKAEERGR